MIQSCRRRLLLVLGAFLATALGAGAAAALPENQPRISRGDVEATAGLSQTTVVDGLEHPWGMAWLPDGAMLITERPGRLRLLRDGELVETPVSGTPEVFASGQGGLLDVAVHPDFAENRFVYMTYAHGTEAANRTRVARAVLDGSELKDLEVIFEVADEKPGGQHFGSRLLWLPDGTLLVSIGDGGNPPTALNGELIRLRAQDLSSHIGKILRLNADGALPEDNPFVNVAGAAPAVWSYGHRNVQGMALDPATEQVWVNEHGALHGDELNRIVAGGNYGWPSVTYSRDYRGATVISPYTSLPGMIDPALVWMQTQAPSGLVVYRGERFAEWQGDIFSGGLASGEIRHIELDEAGRVTRERQIPIGARVRDLREGPDGLLYVLTDEPSGRLLRLEPSN
ncbi:MAG: PQQ-dependent sugar dehydrogenase [Kiloniellales bacterium]|nr:PQQ-dependent sugar dehydrogenase [Kiloniellales bacterium]